MGMMKAFLMEKVSEFAIIKGWTEEETYNNPEKYALALEYTDEELRKLIGKIDESK